MATLPYSIIFGWHNIQISVKIANSTILFDSNGAKLSLKVLYPYIYITYAQIKSDILAQ